jgi:hypothetical protein
MTAFVGLRKFSMLSLVQGTFSYTIHLGFFALNVAILLVSLKMQDLKQNIIL